MTDPYIYASGIAPAEQVNLATGAVTYLVTDSLGSVRGTVNFSGTLTGTSGYDAWGDPESSSGLTATTPFGYAGGYTNPDGLIYLINRYYDPATGQFTSVDPEISQTLQPYAYAAGNPISETDPVGRAVNLRGAASWALANVWGGYNGYSNDCTDFVSRALHFGGGDPESWGWGTWPGPPFNHKDDRYWYKGQISGYPVASYSWGGAHDLANHLVYKGSYRVWHWRYAKVGEVIFANWNGSAYSGISHMGIITAMWNGVPHITQHSPSQKNVSVRYWINNGGSDVHVFIYYPKPG